MPRHREPKKDVISCEKPWDGANNFIHGCPNEETQVEEKLYLHICESITYMGETRGTETSKYPQEKKENSIPKVAASEIGRAQTVVRAPRGMDCI